MKRQSDNLAVTASRGRRRAFARFVVMTAATPLAGPAAWGDVYSTYVPPTVLPVLSGTTVGAPTWNRPAIGVTPAALSGLGTAVPFVASSFVAPTAGTYTLTLASPAADFDKVGFLYTAGFSPASPLSGLVTGGIAHDAPPPHSTPLVFRTSLSAGSHHFVTTGYEDAPLAPAVNAGAFAVTVSYGGSLHEIPDFSPAGVSVPLTVPAGPATVGSLSSIVLHGLLHPYASDLTATLSKGSVSFTFLARAGGSAAFNAGDITFAPTGSTALPAAGTLPPSATYAPQNATNSFTAFDGLPLAGTWTLRLTDSTQNDVGSFTGFSLDLTPGAAGPNTWIADADGTYAVPANWSAGSVPSGPGVAAVFGNAITAPRVVTLAAPVTLGSLSFSSAHAYALAGNSTITLSSGSAAAARVTASVGTHTITAPVTLASNTTASIAPGSVLSLATVTSSGLTSLHLEGGGTLRVTGLLTASSITVEQSAGVPTSFLDLTTGLVVLRDGDETAARALVSDWYAGSLKLARGIGSSASAGDAYTTVAVFPNASGGPDGYYASYAGVPLAPTDLILRRTWLGDTNLDGILDGNDLANLLEGLSTAATGWHNGDLDYDGVVTPADYALFMAAYPFGGTPLFALPSASGAIPEPTRVVPLSVAPLLLTRRARRGAPGNTADSRG